jgi:hypothetical protein
MALKPRGIAQSLSSSLESGMAPRSRICYNVLVLSRRRSRGMTGGIHVLADVGVDGYRLRIAGGNPTFRDKYGSDHQSPGPGAAAKHSRKGRDVGNIAKRVGMVPPAQERGVRPIPGNSFARYPQGRWPCAALPHAQRWRGRGKAVVRKSIVTPIGSSRSCGKIKSICAVHHARRDDRQDGGEFVSVPCRRSGSPSSLRDQEPRRVGQGPGDIGTPIGRSATAKPAPANGPGHHIRKSS